VGIKLSICIPTYNRSPLLRELLNSISASDMDTIHVAISDNASTDDTSGVAEEYRERFPHFDYRCNETNLGPDRNYLAAAEMALGEYFLLMGSDDGFMPNSLDRILDYLKSDPDLLVYNRIDATFDMKPIRRMHAGLYKEPVVHCEIRSENDLVDYLNHCGSIGAVYSYISSVVFRVKRWKSVVCPPQLVGSAYPHTGIFLLMLRQGCALLYTDEPLVLWRSGNDTFLAGDMTRRVLIDLDGYELLAKTIFPDWSAAAHALRLVVAREHTDWYMSSFPIFLQRKLRMTPEGWGTVQSRLYQIKTPSRRYRLYNGITPNVLLPGTVRRVLLACYYVAKKILR
jgi:abequosyltransferase